ncbi:MAG: efflux RND transporter permease subunit [Leptospiraceae bacterium]|nr:efflux RND transporter permease subunit [Leptospiraceae bacterium]
MKSIISYFVYRPLISNLVILFLLLAGGLSLLFIKREAFPNVNLYQVRISTIFPGASPGDVEQKITIPIEEKLREVSGFDTVRSISRNSESEINVKVDIDHKDPDKVVADIRRAVDQVTDLPPQVRDKPLVIEQKSSDFPVMEISVYGGNNEIELQTNAKFIQDELRKVEGVARVDAFAKRKKEWHVLVNPTLKQKYSVGFSDIISSIAERNVSIPGGSINAEYTKDIRVSGEFTEISDLNKLPVRANESGNQIFISQIARLKDTYEKERTLARTNGYDAVNLLIIKKEQSDIIRTVKKIEEKIPFLKKQIPESIQILELNNEGTKTINRLDVVTTNSFQGLILIFIVLFIFFSFRDSVLTSLSLPLSLLGSLLFMPILDISFNLISMLGIIISLGMLVDNSIVISENIYTYKLKGMTSSEAAIQGTSELVVPIVGSYLTTVAAFIPMLSMSGIMGKFIYQIPLMVIITLTMSLFESFFLLPVRIAKYGRDKSIVKETFFGRLRGKLDVFFETVIAKFESFTRILIRRRYLTIFVLFLIFVGSVATLTLMKFNLFPKEGVEQVIVKAEFPPYYTARETLTRMQYVEPILNRIPKSEIIGYTVKIGIQQIDPTDPLARVGEHLGMVHLYFIPENERKRTTAEIMAELEEELKKIPNAETVFIEELINGPPIGAAVTVAVEGKDYKTLKIISKDVQDFLASMDGVKNIADDYKKGREEIIIALDSAKSAATGISVATTASFVRSAFEGNEASRFRIGKEEVRIKVLNDDQYRMSQNDINRVNIINRYGLLTPIYSIVNINSEQGIEALLHFDFEKAITITANVDEKITTSGIVNGKLIDKFKDVENKYPGYTLKFRGEEADTNKSMASLASAGIVAMFGIFAILALIFNNTLKPIFIIMSIPLGLIGVIFGFLISNKSLSFLAMIGIIGLAGVIVNTSIVLVDFIDELQKKGLDKYESLVKASSGRFRPIILTTFTTMAGLIPTAYSIGGSDPVLVPMTLALAWGLGFGTLGALIFIPTIFSIGYDFRDRWKEFRKNFKLQKVKVGS